MPRQSRLCVCGHEYADHYGYMNGCLATEVVTGTEEGCWCSVFVLSANQAPTPTYPQAMLELEVLSLLHRIETVSRESQDRLPTQYIELALALTSWLIRELRPEDHPDLLGESVAPLDRILHRATRTDPAASGSDPGQDDQQSDHPEGSAREAPTRSLRTGSDGEVMGMRLRGLRKD